MSILQRIEEIKAMSLTYRRLLCFSVFLFVTIMGTVRYYIRDNVFISVKNLQYYSKFSENGTDIDGVSITKPAEFKSECQSKNIIMPRHDGAGDNTGCIHGTCLNKFPWSVLPASFQVRKRECTTPEELLSAVKFGSRQWDQDVSLLSDDQMSRIPSVFVPRNCSIPLLARKKACDVLSRFSKIRLIGASLTRHIVLGLDIILSDDWVSGGNRQKECRCDGQFSESKKCRDPVNSLKVETSEDQDYYYRIPRSLCETADVQWGVASNTEMYNRLLYSIYNEFCDVSNTENSVVEKPPVLFLQAGFHSLRNKQSLVEDLDLIMKKFSNCPRPIHVILQFFTSQRRSLDVKYPHQKREVLTLLNAKYAAYAANNWNVGTSFHVLDFMNLTRNSMSSDGLHSLEDVNSYKANTLINLLNLLPFRQIGD